MGEIEVAPVADLEQVRQMVNKLQETPSDTCPKLSPDWCFVDCKFKKKQQCKKRSGLNMLK